MATLLRRIMFWIRRRQLDADLAEELEFHRAARQAALERDGIPADEAAAHSRRAMGNITVAREDARAVWIWSWLENALQDARHTARLVRRQPGFAAAVVAIVALGSAATICVFALLDGLVVKSLPVERPERLVWFDQPSFSHPVFSEIRARVPMFDGLFAWNVDRVYVDWSGSRGDLVAADLLETSETFFPVLGVRPVVGRSFSAGDTATAVISHSAWRRHFASDPSVVGRSIRIDQGLFTVIGIAPPGFFGVAPGMAPEIIVPLASRNDPSQFASTTSSWLHVMGRLKDGVTLKQADAALQVAWPAIMETTTETAIPADQRARFLARKTALMPGHAGFSRVRNQFGDPLWLLMYLVMLLHAAACASVANLLLARGIARRKELAVRLAIGASRARVCRQLFVEALLLIVAGALLGLLAASWASDLLVGLLRTTRSLLVLDTSIGWRTIAFTSALALIVTPIATVLPALAATRGHITTGLKEGVEPGVALLRRWPLGKMLVAIQIAIALVLLAGAAMFGRSLARVLAQDSGIDAERLLVVLPDAAAAGYEGPALREFHAQLLDRLRTVPGVDSAALSWFPPISYPSGGWTQGISVDANARTADDSRQVTFNGITPRYFDTVGITLRRGRDFSDHDTASSPRVAVVNETLARQFFAGQDPIGHRINIARDASRQNVVIVGLVSDARFRRLQEPPRAIAYLPIAQLSDMLDGRNLTVQIRATSNTSAAAAAVRHQLRSTDARVPFEVESVHNRIRESTINERLMAVLSGVLGVAALLLACAGLYGLLAYTVSRHSHEIGVRMALGARPLSVMWMIQRESLVLASIGIVVGLGGTLALVRFVRTLLFQIAPADTLALAAASGVMLLVAAAAAFLPAHRAARVDPVVALRSDA